MKHHLTHKGFTLAEVLVTSGVAIVIAAAAFTFLNAGTVLFAKTFSVNISNNSVRIALDKLAQSLQQSNDFPTLVDAGGTSTTGSAAGIAFDRFLGAPFVVTHPGGAGLPSSATSVTVTRSALPLASPPLPQTDDVLLIDDSTARPRVSTISAGGITSSGSQTITVNFQSALGASIAWSSSNVKAARLVHRVAFIVMPAGTRSEMRYYPSFDAVTDFNDPAKYNVVTEQFASGASEATPFSISDISGERFVNVSLRARVRNYDQVLARKQKSDFQTYLRVDTILRPKSNI